MNVILSFTWKNIKEKKLRTALIILSIMLSTALYFGSFGVSNTIEKTYIEYLTKYYGNAELMVYPNEKSPSLFVKDDLLLDYHDQLNYVIGIMRTNGIYKPQIDRTVQLSIFGYNLEEFEMMHEIFYEEAPALPFKGKEIIISNKTAKEYNLKKGSILAIEINNEQIRFEVVGIAKSTGFFWMMVKVHMV